MTLFLASMACVVEICKSDVRLSASTQWRYDEAKPLYERSHAIWKEALDPEHANVASVRDQVAYLQELGYCSIVA